ncbi:GNAT family N-acetyltransferase [Paenibacillus sonchi]|uniref:GNAT family N-acetyltransferase n=1 Tax=Paenibacillus sonchi TaxID=373687 RepID=UPI001E357895|nr:GNAT family N-acetyltransferase [Paenibacillus sonchi]MCE3201776.1 GNAT family N-acetyltransferase [Paenibacillus sonchi]
MIELEVQDYYKGLPALDQVKINTLFARAVLEQRIPGKVYADSKEKPGAFYVVHPYGMSLVYGTAANPDFYHWLSDYITGRAENRIQAEWLQGDPAGDWSERIDAIAAAHNSTLPAGGRESGQDNYRAIEKNTRVNFSFDREAYCAARAQFFKQEADLVRTGKEHFFAQTGSVLPRFFWRDEEHFLAEGAGYSILEDGGVASTAFSSCITADQLEIGIETAEASRGKGYAFTVCAALIDYCLDHRLEPVWACRLENQGSYYLAQKLGFKPSLTLPYYRLAL